MPDGYDVDPQVLTSSATEILECLDPLAELRLDSICGSDAQAYGHDDLFAAFGEFCVTWQLATSVLGSRSMSAAGMLGAAAESYAQSEVDSVQALAGATE
ncbi:hypothetical protein BLA60_30755 [Actinophytocola xinjiangensis]|uniref:Excreted virulence factor EspC (Type VII ESX diderm) n=1 Tax=Actinophytocola xinjiangensis TaxID=485602 RepID=A0A7Z0WGH0_9PSEU|nr:hypothetical protein [Actinophytocola xinjiangensis]OLF06648.1 hypothetical protein BLA60_30755 [Actinophytocola xinjiangensis]